MKKIFTVWLSLVVGLTLLPTAVVAHVLDSDRTIGAVMHMTPDDDPIAGEASEFFLELKDKTGRFQPQACSCVVTIRQDNQIIFTEALFTDPAKSTTTATTFAFTFPERDVYTIQISGTPKVASAFTPFISSYTVRVDRQTTTATSTKVSKSWFSTHLLHLGGAIIVAIYVVIMIINDRRQERRVS